MIVPWSSRCTCFSLKWNQTGLDFASQEMVVSSFSVKFVGNSSCCSECLVSLQLLQVWTVLSLSAQHSGLWLYFPFLSPVVQMSVAGHAVGLISGVFASLRCWQQKPAPVTRQDLPTRANKRRKHWVEISSNSFSETRFLSKFTWRWFSLWNVIYTVLSRQLEIISSPFLLRLFLSPTWCCFCSASVERKFNFSFIYFCLLTFKLPNICLSLKCPQSTSAFTVCSGSFVLFFLPCDFFSLLSTPD